MHPIGIIQSPYKDFKNIPIQGILKNDTIAWIDLKKEFINGLKDLDRFSHAIIIYYFHKSERVNIEAKPYLENKSHGIFSIRSPNRPNHIGFSIVKIKKIEGNKLYFNNVDVIDGTPVLDIKPYIKYFDIRENAVSGWIDKHFKNGKKPKNIKI